MASDQASIVLAWADVKLQVMALVSAYHSGQLELCRINRSYMVSWVRVARGGNGTWP